MTNFMITKRQLISRRLSCRLDESEVVERAKRMAGLVSEAQEAEQTFAELDGAAKAHKKNVLAPKQGAVAAIAVVVSSQTEIRDVDCSETLDYKASQVIIRRADTDSIVNVRSMTDGELQANMYEEETPNEDPNQLRIDVLEWFKRGTDRPE